MESTKSKIRLWLTPRSWILLGLSVALAPSAAWGLPILFRHVLPCVLEIQPQAGELSVDYGNSTLWYQSSTVPKSLGYAYTETIPTITETQQAITIATSEISVGLSDGNVYTFPSDTHIDRVQYSFGFGGIPVMNAGWVYFYAVPSTTTGQAVLTYLSTPTAPTGPQKYLGSFYLKNNPNCVADECTTGSSLNPNCQNYSDPSTCPTGYGRLQGVSLTRANLRYDYNIQIQYAPSPKQYTPVTNLSALASRVGFIGSNLAIRTFQPSNLTAIFVQGMTWAMNSSQGINVYDFGDGPTGVLATTYMFAHEEPAALYEQ